MHQFKFLLVDVHICHHLSWFCTNDPTWPCFRWFFISCVLCVETSISTLGPISAMPHIRYISGIFNKFNFELSQMLIFVFVYKEGTPKYHGWEFMVEKIIFLIKRDRKMVTPVFFWTNPYEITGYYQNKTWISVHSRWNSLSNLLNVNDESTHHFLPFPPMSLLYFWHVGKKQLPCGNST